MSNSSSSSSGIGFFGMLAIVFIVLKLGGWTEVATWSWWWVLSPLWGGWAICIAFIAVAVLLMAWADCK